MGFFWNSSKKSVDVNKMNVKSKSVIDNLGIDITKYPDDSFIIDISNKEKDRTIYFKSDPEHKFMGLFSELTIIDFNGPGKNYLFKCQPYEFKKYHLPDFIGKICSIYGNDDYNKGRYAGDDSTEINEGFWMGRSWMDDKFPDPCRISYDSDDGLSFTIWLKLENNINSSTNKNPEKMYLFFDTETTGIPISWSAPTEDTQNWPRMVQIAFLLYHEDGTLLETESYIIRPDGFIIPDEVSRIHGITTERALQEGTELSEVLSSFQNMSSRATALVAHNMEFDEKILGCEFIRTTGTDPLVSMPKFCTMKHPNIINYCALPPFRYGKYKWPRLAELHDTLFSTDFDEAHNAVADIQATARCFFELRDRGII